jgi:glucosamine kinase
MILIADSGSTKTDWRIIDSENRIHQFRTAGINPYFQSSEDIVKILQEELIPACGSLLENETISEIWFYGAGCSSPAKVQVVENALNEVFISAQIEVQHDLLAAARAVCGHKPGIAAIMGTGSNSCWYDGEKIVENIPSLGYILGDEGSGAHLGKLLLSDVLTGDAPENISKNFFERLKYSKEDVLEAVYKQPLPNRFLAQFSKFIYQNLKDPYMTDLVARSFEAFFQKHICKYSVHKDLKMGVVGSVAFYFSNILRRVAEENGVEIQTIIESPIAGLALYHLELKEKSN